MFDVGELRDKLARLAEEKSAPEAMDAAVRRLVAACLRDAPTRNDVLALGAALDELAAAMETAARGAENERVRRAYTVAGQDVRAERQRLAENPPTH